MEQTDINLEQIEEWHIRRFRSDGIGLIAASYGAMQGHFGFGAIEETLEREAMIQESMFEISKFITEQMPL